MPPECGIIDDDYDTTSADLVWSKVKPRGERKINYRMFMDVLNMIAYQKGVNYESVAKTIVACGGPVNKGTKVRHARSARARRALGARPPPPSGC